MRKGVFITFEGPEKSGKSTQAKLLYAYLRKKGYKTLFIREPGSTSIGEKIRQILLDKKNLDMALMTEMLLYMAARAQVISEAIAPALKSGMVVVCDRFLDSTVAYQGYGGGMDPELIRSIGRRVTQGNAPDITLLLDFWQSRFHLKNQAQPDRIEMRPDAFHLRVKKGYLALARREPGRIKVVHVAADRNQTQERIRELVESCLSRKLSDRKRR